LTYGLNTLETAEGCVFYKINHTLSVEKQEKLPVGDKNERLLRPLASAGGVRMT
jgi:hypothetical protein